MDDRTNTIAGWVLAGCGAALGLSIVGGMLFHGERPEKMGYAIEGVVEEGAGGGAPDVAIASLLPTADAAKGAEVFKKCAACHTINQGGANGIGPNLYGTMGEGIGQGKGGFAFTDALKGVGGTWDFDKMNAWLTSPRKFAAGTKMTFAGLGNAQDRANVILYLNQQGSNLPLPAAPAAGAPAAEGADQPATANAAEAAAENGADTADIANTGTAASGAPSVDPEAARKGARTEQ
ncbi:MULTISPECIES: c-type cytochrome [unclassified Sphingomonas]|uniref:c-type cytochrome n=1 Tax=unclassified Sphingomonas TaxID=196159 RepID=UPI0006FA6A8A|nr:c-type cytochrome [Sphingomonas sp. Leaf20]KQM73913.1 cytochrome C [Sphingomonas sp. Leaf20]